MHTKKPLQSFCFGSGSVLVVLFVQQVQVFKKLEGKAHNNSNNSCQHHSLYGKAPKESFAPERPIIIITEVITRLEDLL